MAWVNNWHLKCLCINATFTATFVKNKCKFLGMLLQQKLALIFSGASWMTDQRLQLVTVQSLDTPRIWKCQQIYSMWGNASLWPGLNMIRFPDCDPTGFCNSEQRWAESHFSDSAPASGFKTPAPTLKKLQTATPTPFFTPKTSK